MDMICTGPGNTALAIFIIGYTWKKIIQIIRYAVNCVTSGRNGTLYNERKILVREAFNSRQLNWAEKVQIILFLQ